MPPGRRAAILPPHHFSAPQAPGFGERRKALLQDIAIVTGAEFVAKDLGMKVETTTLEQLGVARKLTVANSSTTMIADQVGAAWLC